MIDRIITSLYYKDTLPTYMISSSVGEKGSHVSHKQEEEEKIKNHGISIVKTLLVSHSLANKISGHAKEIISATVS